MCDDKFPQVISSSRHIPRRVFGFCFDAVWSRTCKLSNLHCGWGGWQAAPLSAVKVKKSGLPHFGANKAAKARAHAQEMRRFVCCGPPPAAPEWPQQQECHIVVQPTPPKSKHPSGVCSSCDLRCMSCGELAVLMDRTCLSYMCNADGCCLDQTGNPCQPSFVMCFHAGLCARSV